MFRTTVQLLIVILAGCVSVNVAFAQDQVPKHPETQALLDRQSRELTEVNVVLSKAYSALYDGRLDRAESLCSVALNLFPDVADESHRVVAPVLGEVLLASGALAPATAEFEYLEGRGYQNPDVRASLALCYLKQNRLGDAQALLERLAVQNPTLLAGPMEKAHVPDISGGDPTAMEVTCHLIRAAAFCNAPDRLKGGFAEFDAAVKLDPSNLGINYLIGFTYYSMTKFAEVKKEWEPIMKAKGEAELKKKTAQLYVQALAYLKNAAASGPRG